MISQAQSFLDCEPITSASQQFAFDPETLAQRAQSDEMGNSSIFYSNDALFGLAHENQHWFHFVGSSFGVAFLTLRRATELLLYETLFENGPDSKSKAEAVSRMRAGLPILSYDGETLDTRHLSSDSRLRVLGERLKNLNLISRLFLDSNSQSRCSYDRGMALLQAFRATAYAYRYHGAGHCDPDDLGGFEHVGRLLSKAGNLQSVILGEELTTRHIMECSAFLVEISHLWLAILTDPAHAHSRTFDYDSCAVIRDLFYARREAPKKRYSLCIEYALSQWSKQSPGWNPSWSDDMALVQAAPTILACCELALNPPLPPLGLGTNAPLTWENLFPPFRLESLVHAVSKVGLLPRVPTNAEYHEYADSLCREAKLTLCTKSTPVAQNPKVSWRCCAEMSSEELTAIPLSYFDYLLWSFQQMATFRESAANVTACTTLLNYPQAGLALGPDITDYIVSPEFSWLQAPILWHDEDWVPRHGITPTFVGYLTRQTLTGQVLAQALRRAGTFDLSRRFPPCFWAGEERQMAIKALICNALRIDEFENWSILNSHSVDHHTNAPRMGQRRAGDPDTGRHEAIVISRHDIERRLTQPTLEKLLKLRQDPASNVRSLDFSIHGYYGDERGLWDVPEVREFIKNLNAEFPFWLFYLKVAAEPVKCPAAAALVYACLIPSFRRPEKADVLKFLELGFHYMNSEMELASFDEVRQKQMTDDVSAWIQAMFQISFA
jgi:hypothetical protein